MNPAELVSLLSSRTVYDLEQPRYHGAPCFAAHEPGFMLHLHRRHEPGLGEARTSASGLITMAEHNGTHIDALCHQAMDMRLHGDVEVTAQVQTSKGFTRMAADSIEPIIRRGVLLDVPAACGPLSDRQLISAEQLAAAQDRQGTETRPGDVVLVRTGNGARYADRAAYEAGPGIGTDASRWLAAEAPFAVGADNVAWDLPGHTDDGLCCTLPGHVVLLVGQGVFILENVNLEALAADEAYEFCFVCLPLKMVGATGSPVRPVAIA